MSERLDPAAHPWMLWESTRAVMNALSADAGDARFVGGAVRNALMGEDVADIDIATPLLPEAVTQRLKKAGLAAIPTGIAHGTVTAVAAGRPFEITTLRRDVATDGRRAVVAYTRAWEEDAQRRDFTMNALYLGQDGTVFDDVGGVDDLRAGRVRFVGDARTRIREDYLRVLRLFRFHAWYGKGALDAEALAASAAEKAGLQTLSGERIRKEMLRLLDAPGCVPVLRAMDENAVLAEILAPPVRLERLEALVSIVHAHSYARDPLLLLAALLPDLSAAQTAAARWRLSNAERDRVFAALDATISVAPSLSVEAACRLLYRVGKATFRDRLFLCWAQATDFGAAQWSALLVLAQSFAPPQFPLDGDDVLAAGAPSGPAVGHILTTMENWWVEQDFAPSREALLARLKEHLGEPNA